MFNFVFDYLSVVNNLASNVIWLILGVAMSIAYKFFHVIFPNRRLWGLHNPTKAYICTSTTRTDTGIYSRPSTGIGQLKALAFIVKSLHRAYKNFDFNNIMYSEEEIKQNIEDDLILLGGPKNNQITKLFFKKFDSSNLVLQNEDGSIYWQKTNIIYRGATENGIVVKDFGIIVKTNNFFSFSGKTKLMLFSGCHTYGTIASARYFCECMNKDMKKDAHKNYVLLISCDIINGYPVKMKLVDKIIL